MCEEGVVVPRSIEWDGDQWHQWVQGQAWRRTGVEWMVEAGNLRPVTVMATELEHRGRASTRVVMDEAWGQVVEWGQRMATESRIQQMGSRCFGRPRPQGDWGGELLGVVRRGVMGYDGREELMGCWEDWGMVHDDIGCHVVGHAMVLHQAAIDAAARADDAVSVQEALTLTLTLTPILTLTLQFLQQKHDNCNCSFACGYMYSFLEEKHLWEAARRVAAAEADEEAEAWRVHNVMIQGSREDIRNYGYWAARWRASKKTLADRRRAAKKAASSNSNTLHLCLRFRDPNFRSGLPAEACRC